MHRAIAALLDVPSLQLVQHYRPFTQYIQQIQRVAPWYDGDAGDACTLLSCAWEQLTLRADQSVAESAGDSDSPLRSGTGPGGEDTTSTAAASLLQPVSPLQARKHDSRRTRAGTSLASVSGEAGTSRISDQNVPLSAWAILDNMPDKLRAATQFLESFPQLGKRLSDEPMLTKVRLDALQVLSTGRLSEMAIATEFLRAYREQCQREDEISILQDLQRIGNAKRTSVALPNQPDTGIHQHDDFNLSDGEAASDYNDGSPDES